MLKKLYCVLFFVFFFAFTSNLHGQWRGGDGQGRIGTGLKDSPTATSGVWYATGLLDWIFVEDLAKSRARANGHPQRYNEYLVRFMPEPPNILVAPPVLPPAPIPPPFPNPNPVPIPPPVQPQPNYDYMYWAPSTGIYKAGLPTEGSDYLSDNGRYNNPYREIRFVKILYRGPEQLDLYASAVRDALSSCKDKDQTYEQGADNKFFVSASKDVGPRRKFIFAWGDDISKQYGFVVVESVENGRMNCMTNNGRRSVAVDNPTNFQDWYLGSYRGEISVNRGSGARLAVVPTGKRNVFASVQLWLHHGNIAACFRIRDLQN